MNQLIKFTPDLAMCPSGRLLPLLMLFCGVINHVILVANSQSHGYSGWPECSDMIYDEFGRVDVGQVLYNCSANIPGVKLPPSLYNTSVSDYTPTIITTSLNIGNLVEVDDVITVIEIDFYFRLSWNDTRWNIPQLFDYVNPECLTEGIDLTALINDGNNPLPIYLPDLSFYQSLDINVISELVKLYKDGSFYWSRHMFVSFAEPVMNFKKYPLDAQNFSLVFQSYAFDSNFVTLKPSNPPVSFHFDEQQGELYVQENQLWQYDSYTSYVELHASPTKKNPNRAFCNQYVNLRFLRQPLGVVYRLALPVTILLLIVGFSFWANLDQRTDVTINMLLVVAALYIVIGQVIPFVGYLSIMDVFTTATFALLSATVGVNIIVMKLTDKQTIRPMNIFHVDLIQFIMRVVWIPMVIMMFIITFDIHIVAIKALLYSAALICLVNGVLKIKYLKRSHKTSILLLRAKEMKLKEIKTAVVTLDHSRQDSDDEYEEDEDLHEHIKEAFKLKKDSAAESDESREEAALKKKGRELKLSFLEQFVLNCTRHMYNSSTSQAEVFGSTGLANVVNWTKSVLNGSADAINSLGTSSNTTSNSSNSSSSIPVYGRQDVEMNTMPPPITITHRNINSHGEGK